MSEALSPTKHQSRIRQPGLPQGADGLELILTQLSAEGCRNLQDLRGRRPRHRQHLRVRDDAVKESLDTIGEALAENGKVIVTAAWVHALAKAAAIWSKSAPQRARRHRPTRHARGDGGGTRPPAQAARPVPRLVPGALARRASSSRRATMRT